jgi:hypothetical protein
VCWHSYLGATPEQLAAFDSSHRRWGQGTVQITLQPCRKNLAQDRLLAALNAAYSGAASMMATRVVKIAERSGIIPLRPAIWR